MTSTDVANLALSKIGEILIDSIDDTADKSARKALLHYEPALKEVLRAHFWDFALAVAEIPAKLGGVGIRITGTITSDGTTPVICPFLPHTTDNGDKPQYNSADLTFPYGAGEYLVIWDFDESKWLIHADGGTWESGDDVATPDLVTTWTALASSTGTPVITLEEKNPQFIGWAAAFPIPADVMKLRKVMTADATRIDKFAIRRLEGERCILAGDHETISLEYVQFLDEPSEWDPLFLTAFVTLLASRLARAVTGNEKLESQLLAEYKQDALPAARTADAHDSQSNENHPLKDFLAGNLLGSRGDFFPEDRE